MSLLSNTPKYGNCSLLLSVVIVVLVVHCCTPWSLGRDGAAEAAAAAGVRVYGMLPFVKAVSDEAKQAMGPLYVQFDLLVLKHLTNADTSIVYLDQEGALAYASATQATDARGRLRRLCEERRFGGVLFGRLESVVGTKTLDISIGLYYLQEDGFAFFNQRVNAALLGPGTGEEQIKDWLAGIGSIAKNTSALGHLRFGPHETLPEPSIGPTGNPGTPSIPAVSDDIATSLGAEELPVALSSPTGSLPASQGPPAPLNPMPPPTSSTMPAPIPAVDDISTSLGAEELTATPSSMQGISPAPQGPTTAPTGNAVDTSIGPPK